MTLKRINMKRLFPLLVLIIFSLNNKLYSQKKNYIKEISFDFTHNLPIIEVNINGENYNFLFDTGMPSTISERLNKKLKLNSTRNTIGSDVNGNKNRENYTILQNLKILDIDFNNTEVLIANLESSFELKCLQLDGVFGNNLIKNAIWEINYETKKIRFTNDIGKLNVSNDFTKIKFRTKNGFTPKISLKINGKKIKNMMFDTGSNGGINIPIEEYSSKKFKTSIEYFGSSKVALYGRSKKNKSIISKVDIQIGGLKMKNQLLVFNKTTPLVGNRFFSNFNIIIDYSQSTIYLDKKRNTNNIQSDNFGFLTNIIGNKMVITAIFKNSIAFEKLKLGDEILSINNTPVSKILDNNPCGYIQKVFKENKTNTFKIKHENEILNLELTKKNILH